MLEARKQMEFSMSKVNDRSLRNARNDLKRFEELIEKTMAEKNFTSVKEATNYIEEKYYNTFFLNRGINVSRGSVSIKQDTTRSDFFLLKTGQAIKSHPEHIWEIYDKLSPEDRKELLPVTPPFLRYTPDMKENYKMVLKDLSRNILDYLKIDRKKFIDGTLSYEERVAFQKGVLLIIGKNMNILNEDFKSSCTRRISNMAKLLDKYGEFETGTSRYNDIMRRIGLEELKVEYQKSKKGNKPQFTTMKDLENPKVVEKLPLDVQIGISVFLTNRLAKIFSSYKKSKFILQQKGKLEAMSDLDTRVSDKELQCILGKFDYLQNLCRTIYSETAAAVLQDFQEEDQEASESIFYKDIKINLQDEEPDYKEFFDSFSPNLDNDLGNNLDEYTSSNTIYEGIYERKDFDFHALIASLLDKDTSKINWGYIPEMVEDKNSIQRNKRMVLIGVDFEGFNFPIKIHCSKKELLDLVKKYTGKCEIPVYRGDEDWTVKSEYDDVFKMTGQVITPFDKMKRKFIKEKMQTMTPDERNADYLLHLNWMVNPNEIPKKLTERKVVSLVTGEIMPENQRNFGEQ